MVQILVRVARHGRSTVLVVPPEEARRAGLRPGQRLIVEAVDEPDEPWFGSWKKYGITNAEWKRLEKGMWE